MKNFRFEHLYLCLVLIFGFLNHSFLRSHSNDVVVVGFFPQKHRTFTFSLSSSQSTLFNPLNVYSIFSVWLQRERERKIFRWIQIFKVKIPDVLWRNEHIYKQFAIKSNQKLISNSIFSDPKYYHTKCIDFVVFFFFSPIMGNSKYYRCSVFSWARCYLRLCESCINKYTQHWYRVFFYSFFFSFIKMLRSNHNDAFQFYTYPNGLEYVTEDFEREISLFFFFLLKKKKN